MNLLNEILGRIDKIEARLEEKHFLLSQGIASFSTNEPLSNVAPPTHLPDLAEREVDAAQGLNEEQLKPSRLPANDETVSEQSENEDQACEKDFT